MLIEVATIAAILVYLGAAATDERRGTQAWADAVLARPHWPAEEPPVVIAGTTFSGKAPFSFVYGGVPSDRILASWKRSCATDTLDSGRKSYTVTYSDPATGLQVVCEALVYGDYPAVEWVVYFRNNGSVDTPVIRQILPLDLHAGAGGTGDIILHHVNDSCASETDFRPLDEIVQPNARITLAPHHLPAGEIWQHPHTRLTPGSIPYFNLEWPGGGIVGAIGWTGQWNLDVRRDGSRGLTVQAGQEITHLKLYPGESIRTPRILLVMWEGPDRMRGHNFLRRLLFADYVPKMNGDSPVDPISHCTFVNFNTGNDVTEGNQIEVINSIPDVGMEAFWVDAGWYVGGWSDGSGNWTPKPEAFPDGLKPVGDAAHRKGLKFILWFEPEHVHRGTQIANEHPEWVMHAGSGEWGGLFNLGDPAARRWMTDLLSKCITDWGIDIYRQDRNISPVAYWRAADRADDARDRRGISEIRHTEGLYAMWDELLRRHPGLQIDNANWRWTGPDIEMVKRSIGSLTRSEYTLFGGMYAHDQMGNAALSQYVPLGSSCVKSLDAYSYRSGTLTGVMFNQDPRSEDFPLEAARLAISETKALRPYYSGDFYPLTEIDSDESVWCGWQFDRPDLGAGFALFFRRPQCASQTFNASLRGIDPQAAYEVAFKETFYVKEQRTVTGAQLADLPIEIDSAPGSLLILYRKLPGSSS